MKLYLDMLLLFALISVERAIGASLATDTTISSDKMMPPILSCPDPAPVEGATCESPFNCEVGEFCCPEDDSVCVPEKSCYCDESTSLVVCYDSYYQIVCPSMCPTTRPQSNDACALDSRYLCNYGNPLDCKDVDVNFDFERQCSCYNGTFSCYDNVCPVPCPTTQPDDGEKCSPFAPGNCEYGEFCCPGDGGECVPDKSCYCDGISSYCYDAYNTIACPSVCPETPPNNMDSCDIDSRFQCNYGDAFTCDNNVDEFGVISFDFEKQCTCYDGTFSCYSNACPEPCPDVEPQPGSSCSPFVTYSCGYDKYCCDGADSETCVAMTECYCDYDLTTRCSEPSIYCPSKCPVIKPENGQSCDLEQRLTCKYNEGSCPSTECSCVQGVYVCNEICYDYFEDSGKPIFKDTANASGMAQGSEGESTEDDVVRSDDDVDNESGKGKKKDKKTKEDKTRTKNEEVKGKKGKKSDRRRK
jgi:hypothetical protein